MQFERVMTRGHINFSSQIMSILSKMAADLDYRNILWRHFWKSRTQTFEYRLYFIDPEESKQHFLLHI